MTYEPEWEPRECVCGHREHNGQCRSNKFVYIGSAAPVEPTWRPMPTHQRAADAGLQMYAAPCTCPTFYEYEGEEP